MKPTYFVTTTLNQNPGHLRLFTVKVVSDLPEAQNTLTQRPFAKYDQTIPTVAVTKMDAGNMRDGDIAGLAVFQDTYAYIAVKQDNGSKHLIMVNNGETIETLPMKSNFIYLRTIASNSTKIASFEYSFNNTGFTPLGNELIMKFNLSVFTGNKFCLLNYATIETGGYVDFDWIITM